MNIPVRLLCTILLVFTLAASPVSYAEAAAKFEYKTVDLGKSGVKSAQQLEVLLNQFGVDGWELIEINFMGHAIFKRQK